MYKNILITGGGNGLGKLIAEHLYDKGHRIFILDKIENSQIDQNYFKKLEGYYCVDLGSSAEVELFLGRPELKIIDVLINNAAIRSFKLFPDFNSMDISSYLMVNTLALLQITNKFINHKKTTDYFRVINISSRAAYNGYKLGSLYASTKAFINNFTESLHKDLFEFNRNITVNTICPSALISLENLKSPSFDTNMKRILNYIDKIINSNISGFCFNTLSIKEKAFYSFKSIMKIFNGK